MLPTEGAASKIVVVSGDGQTQASGSPLAEELVVLVTDAADRPVVGQAVVFAPAEAGHGDVTPDTVITDAAGQAATQWVLGPSAGAQQARAGVLVNGAVSSKLSVTFSATAVAGTAARLIITTQPSNVVAGVAIAPAVKVEVQDANGNRVTGATTPVTFVLATNPSGATLTGGGPVNAVDGVATFSNLSLNRSGTGYTLTATAPGGFVAATSVAFNVAPAVPSRLEINLPSAVAAGATITPAEVTVRDAFGNVATSPSVAVTVAIQDNPAAGTLSGTKTVNTVAGVATFTNLSINKVGNSYSLRATAGSMSIESASLNVLPGNSNRLSFRVQPASSTVGATLNAIEVVVLDANGNLVSGASNPVTIVSSETGTLAGTSAVTAVNGVARFTNLRITKAGTGYSLSAFASGLADAASAAFDVAKAATTVTITSRSPTTSVVGQPVTVSYNVDVTAPGSGNLTGNVTISDGTTTCPGNVTSSGTGSCSITFNTVGTRTLTATYSGDANFVGSTSPGVSHVVDKASTTLNITSDSPDPSRVGQPVLVKWSFSVASPGGGSPTGSFQVSMAGDAATCTAPVSARQCELTPTSAGDSRTITAEYNGDANYNGDSDTEAHRVQVATTTTTVVATPNPSMPLEPVTANFTVTTSSGLAPTGTVSVRVNGTERCTANVSTVAGVTSGSCEIPGVAFGLGGSFTVAAAYPGDANHGSSTGSVPHAVTIVNTAPVANDDPNALTVDEDANVTSGASVLANDTDAESPSGLTATVVTGPTHASSFTLNANGTFSYKPEADYNGTDTFTYQASDGEELSNVATVTITVRPVNDAPSFTMSSSDMSIEAINAPVATHGMANVTSLGAGNESTQEPEYLVTVTQGIDLFDGVPTIDAEGTLRFTPAGTPGVAKLSVVLKDNGGTANGGVDTSEPQILTITFTEPPTP